MFAPAVFNHDVEASYGLLGPLRSREANLREGPPRLLKGRETNTCLRCTFLKVLKVPNEIEGLGHTVVPLRCCSAVAHGSPESYPSSGQVEDRFVYTPLFCGSSPTSLSKRNPRSKQSIGKGPGIVVHWTNWVYFHSSILFQ